MPADKSHLRDRKNAEKASVAQIVAQNNETLSKLIASERSNFSDQGNNTYIDKKGVTRDAIGREIEVGSGYDLHSGITPADKSINNVQSDYTLNNNAQRAIMSDEKVHEAAKVGEQLKEAWKEGVISAFGNKDDVVKNAAIDEFANSRNGDDISILDQALNDEILNISDKDLKISSGVAGKEAQKEAAENAEKLMHEMAQDTKKAEILASQVAEEGLKQQALHDRLQNDRIDAIANQSDAAARKKAEEQKRLENANRYAEMFADSQDKSTPADTFATNLAKGSEELQEALKSGEINNNSIGFNIAEQTANAERQAYLNGLGERLEAERHGGEEEARQAQLQKERMTEVLNRTKNERTGGDFEGQRYADLNTGVGNLGQGVNERKMKSLNQTLVENENNYLQASGAADANYYIAPEYNEGPTKRSSRKNRNRYGSDGNFRLNWDKDDPYSFTTYTYPRNVANDFTNGHYMLFYINVQNKTKYEYQGYDKKGNSVTVGETYIEQSLPPQLDNKSQRAANRILEGSGDVYKSLGAPEFAKKKIAKGGKGNLLYSNQKVLSKQRKPRTGINSRFATTTRITDSVALYLPPNVQDSTSANYGEFATGMAGYLAMGGIDLVRQVQQNDFAGAAKNLLGNAETIATEAFKKFSVAAVETFTGSQGVQETFDKAFGQTLNPYLALAFNSMGMRTFQYTFKFAPKDEQETYEVNDIIKLFRFHMAPELKGTNERYMTLPSTFDIHYMYQFSETHSRENEFYNKIATCVLNNVSVDYTPDGVKSFDSGAPTQINMTLSFQETEMLTKQKIEEGF